MISFKGKKILVVDDEEYLREILIDEFTSYEATAIGAENGKVAFGLFKHHNFDALVSDLKMPGGDGLTLMREVKENIIPRPKMFLYSGFNDIPKETTMNLGIEAVFGKPFEIEKMMEIIAHSLKDLKSSDE